MKKMIEITFDENGSITHDVLGKFGSASVLLKKAPDGTGAVSYTHLDVYKRQIQDLQLRFLTQEYLFRRHATFLMPSEVRMYRQHLVF